MSTIRLSQGVKMSTITDNPPAESLDKAPGLAGIHHVAYRCRNAKETVAFYEVVLGMEFVSAFSEDHVPSTGTYDPYMHVFLDCGGSNILAFFELPEQPDMGKDPNTPEWVQHIAFRVATLDDLIKGKERAEAAGLDVIGPTHHGIFKSVYFFDPNGHRLELTCDIATAEQLTELKNVAADMLDEWDETKKSPRHAAWLHEIID
jgi:glyoxylase I family protein